MAAAEQVITKELLQQAFRTCEGRTDIEVLDFIVSKAASFGDGFLSLMHGVKAEVKEETHIKTISVVIKTMSTNPGMKSLVKESKMFTKELGCYKTIIPALVDFQCERNAKPIIPAVPKFYAGCDETDDTSAFIMLEDLRPLNFKMANVREGLDVDHCLLVVKELAKLHALSFAYKTGNIDTFNDWLDEYLFDVMKDTSLIEKINYSSTMCQAFKTATDIFKSSFEDGQMKTKLADSFERMEKNPYAAMIESLSQPTDTYGVICHGDAWCNNMMFRYGEDGRPAEVKLIDFQICRYALPTTDLAYFLFYSATHETRKQHFDDLLTSYHSVFHETLAHLGAEAPDLTLVMLKDMFQRTAAYGVLSAFHDLPGILAEQTSLSEIEKSESVSEMMKTIDGFATGNDLIKKRINGVIQDAILLNL